MLEIFSVVSGLISSVAFLILAVWVVRLKQTVESMKAVLEILMDDDLNPLEKDFMLRLIKGESPE